jgi:transcriptional regulator with XRE-family HTH domain
MNLAEYVDLKMKEKGLSRSDIERNSGKLVTDGHVAYILAGKGKNPTLKVLLGLAKGLEVDPVEVFKAAASIHQDLVKQVWTPRTLLQTMEQAVDNEDLGRIVQSLAKQKPAKIKAVKKLLEIE